MPNTKKIDQVEMQPILLHSYFGEASPGIYLVLQLLVVIDVGLV